MFISGSSLEYAYVAIALVASLSEVIVVNANFSGLVKDSAVDRVINGVKTFQYLM